jgi:regulator of replication initiation timing
MGKKKTAKEIRETAYNDAAKRSKARIVQLQGDYKKMSDKCRELQVENFNLKEENEKLKDWVARLLEYTNMTEDQLKQFIETENKRKRAADAIDSYARMFRTLGLYI